MLLLLLDFFFVFVFVCISFSYAAGIVYFLYFSLVLYGVCNYITMTFHLAVGEHAWFT